MYESTCVPIEAVASLQPVTALCLRDRHHWVNFTLISGNTIGVSVAEQTNDSTLTPIYLYFLSTSNITQKKKKKDQQRESGLAEKKLGWWKQY